MSEFFWEADGILLRVFEERDAECICNMLNDSSARVVCDHGMPLPYGTQDAQAFIEYAYEGLQRGDAVCLAISDRQENICGYVNLSRIDERAGFANLCVYVSEAYRNRGIAAVATTRMLTYAFDERRLHKIEMPIPETAESASRFAENIGFTKEYEKKESYYIDGSYVNELGYGITEEAFRARNKHRDEIETPLPKQDAAIREDTAGRMEAHTSGIDDTKSKSYWQVDELLLRPIREEECIINRELLLESDAYRFYENTVGLPYFVGEADEQEADCMVMDLDGKRLLFAMEDCSGNYVGNVQLHSIDRRHGTFSFSFFTRKQYRGKGYATKALRKIITYAFDELRLHKCEGTYNEGNDASKRVMEKLGLTYEGTKKETVFYKGTYIDAVCMGITAEEWNR